MYLVRYYNPVKRHKILHVSTFLCMKISFGYMHEYLDIASQEDDVARLYIRTLHGHKHIYFQNVLLIPFPNRRKKNVENMKLRQLTLCMFAFSSSVRIPVHTPHT